MIRLTIRIASALLLALSLALSLTACSDDGAADPESISPSATEEADGSEAADGDEEAEDDGDNDAQQEALDAYIEAVEQSIPDLLEDFNGQFSDLRIEAESPGTIVYEYVIAEQVDAESFAQSMDSQKDTYQELADMVLEEMNQNGITESREVVYTYLNADETEIWSESFVPSDSDE